MDLNQRIGQRVKQLRDTSGLSLEALAESSGVSRSNISLIERGQSSPTAVVLDRLSGALGVTVASLFEPAQPAAVPSPLLRVHEQPLWQDPATGYVRRNVSPVVGAPLQLVDVLFPAGQRIAYDQLARPAPVRQQVWMIDGRMDIRMGDALWRLEPGDCLAMTLDHAIVFHNPGPGTARYLVALVTLPAASRKAGA
ncbi:helix-turn-helix domain-containing protein [Ideonella sp.]|uniref:helix-turn-helix domain-containing protein n=1 Tax=Ideonella sp. TaxID=1929293 RepID=UPI0035B096DD